MDRFVSHPRPPTIERNIDKLAGLFPSVVTETLTADGTLARAIDWDALRQEFADRIVEGPAERYRLDWPGKRAAAFAANAPIAKTLRPVREESVEFDTTENLFIEGDNLDALKLLQESYLGKVKLIYIDPPYNTGNDFIYPDTFAGGTDAELKASGQRDSAGHELVSNPQSDGRFHSNWLSMMYARLKAARLLLTNDGVIIVAIGDQEHANLRGLLDHVFGADNFLANVVWQGSGKNDARFTSGGLDYMLVYARNKRVLVEQDARFRSPKRGYEEVLAAGAHAWEESGRDAAAATVLFRAWWKSKPDVEPGLKAYSDIDESGRVFTRGDLASPNPRENLMYELTHPSTGHAVPMPRNGWRLSRHVMHAQVLQGRILFGPDHTTMPRFKRFLNEMDSQAIRPLVTQERAPASDALARLLAGKYFDYPKDTHVLATWINAVTSSDRQALVVDFFAGSSSTAHAVMDLNAADAGTRRFIMVQVAEPVGDKIRESRADFRTIADIGRERLRRAGAEIRRSAGNGVHIDTGFRSLHVSSTNKTNVLQGPDTTHQLQLGDLESSIKHGRSAEDLLFEVMLEWGLEVSLPISVEEVDGHVIHVVDAGALVACFDLVVDAGLVTVMAQRRPLRAVLRDDAFTSDAERINAEQIFRELSPATDLKAL